MFNTSHDHKKIYIIDYSLSIVFDGHDKTTMMLLTWHNVMLMLMILCGPIPPFHKPYETIHKDN
jgi:hypothetical protein